MLIDLKKDLRKIRPVLDMIKMKKERLEFLRELAYSIPSGFGNGGSIGFRSVDSLERRVIAAADLERELTRYVSEHAEFLLRMEKLTAVPSTPELERLIQLRYYKGFSWGKISHAMCYSLPHIYRLHFEALQEMLPVYEKMTETNKKIVNDSNLP